VGRFLRHGVDVSIQVILTFTVTVILPDLLALFNFHRWGSVKSFICGLGMLNLACFYFKVMSYEVLLSFISYYKYSDTICSGRVVDGFLTDDCIVLYT